MYNLIEQINDIAADAIDSETISLLEEDWCETFGYYRADLVEAYVAMYADSEFDGIGLARLSDALISYICDFQTDVLNVYRHHHAVPDTVAIASTQELEVSLDWYPVGRALMRRSTGVQDMVSRRSDMTISRGYGYVYCPMQLVVDLGEVPNPLKLVDMYS